MRVERLNDFHLSLPEIRRVPSSRPYERCFERSRLRRTSPQKGSDLMGHRSEAKRTAHRRGYRREDAGAAKTSNGSLESPETKIDKVFNTLVDSSIQTVVCRHEQNGSLHRRRYRTDDRKGRRRDCNLGTRCFQSRDGIGYGKHRRRPGDRVGVARFRSPTD